MCDSKISRAMTSSPSINPKSFYGTKKRHLVTENVSLPSEEMVLASSNDHMFTRAAKRLRFEKEIVHKRKHVDELISQHTALLSVKQAFLENKSVSFFKKANTNRNENKMLERALKTKTYGTKKDDRQIVPVNNVKDNRKLLPKQIQELDFSSSESDEEIIFKAQNNVLDSDASLDEVDNFATTREQTIIDENIEPVTESPNANVKTECHKERKFFKTRSPSLNVTARSILCQKGFDLKYLPWNSKKTNKFSKFRNGVLHNSSLAKSQVKSSSKKGLSGIPSPNKQSTGSPAISNFICAPGFELPVSDNSHLLLREETIPSSCTSVIETPATIITTENIVNTELIHETFNSLMGDLECQASNFLTELNMSDSDASQHNSSMEKNVLEKSESTSPADTSTNKVFPIFNRKTGHPTSVVSKKSTPKACGKSPSLTKKFKMKDGGTSQMILDAGQKEIGPIVCSTCSMVYFKGDPVDEAQHDKHHMRAVKEIKFPGWKAIRVVQEYPETLGSVVLILPSDLKCKGVGKKLDEVYQAMASDLGDLEITPFYAHHLKVFLYIEDKKVCGCCMAEPIKEGNRILMTDSDTVVASERRPWRCNEQSEPAAVGISRLWIPVENRRNGIATKLVDCVRQWFNYGILIPKTKVAFSDPTPDGFNFFQKYMSSSTFLVYKYNA